LKGENHRFLLMCLVILSATVLTIPIAGFVGIMGKATAAPEEAVLRVGFMQGVDKLNPFVGLSDAAYVFYGLVYDALHSVGNDFETVGNLALDWAPVPASDPDMVAAGEPYGSVWEFVITQNATWHDGEPFTVEDVVWNINENCGGDNYYDMWAYQPYAYNMEYAEINEDKWGPNTVRIHFFDRETGEPKPAAYAQLICIPMVPKHLLEDQPISYIGFDWSGVFDGSTPPLVGTGPFMATENILNEFQNENYMILVRNPNYHATIDSGKEVKFDKIIMRFYDEMSAMDSALRAGEIDVAQFPPQAYYAIKQDVEDGSLENVETYDGLRCTQYWTQIGINMDSSAGPNPTRCDLAVRKALAMATDKESIVENYYLDFAEPGSTLISPVNTLWHYEPTADEMLNYDLEAAAAMLENAGYRYPYEGATTRVATGESLAVTEGWVAEGKQLQYTMMVRGQEYPEEFDIATFIKNEWEKIGVSITIDNMPEDQLSTLAYKYGYDMLIWYWSADPDPNFMLFCQAKASWDGWSDNLYLNESYEENYSKSIEEFDPVKRLEYVHNCQRTHYEDVGYILLAYPYQTYAWRTDTFDGWGDWENDPARSFDAFWTANPLFFDLEYLGGTDGGGVDPLIVVAVLGAIVAVIAVVVVLMKTGKLKKKGGDEGGDTGSPLGD